MSDTEAASDDVFGRGMSYIQNLGKSFLDIDLGP